MTLIVVMVGLVLALAVAGFIALRGGDFVDSVSGLLKGATGKIQNKTINETQKIFCERSCETCCRINDDTQQCQDIMTLQEVEVGEKKIPCSEIPDWECECN